MDDCKLRCAEAALLHVPESYRTIGASDLTAVANGHHFHRGMHLGWAWGENEHGCFLDFLSEHRMAGMSAARFFGDGSSEPIETPAEFRISVIDPDEDAELERAYVERNRASYGDLRERGLLPPVGANLGSQDINEYLRSDEDHSPSEK